ncbi:hypothetical protein MKX01_040510 [Papaver californicum]|nr:hypothetical protein MKX01_040510 [Papaver californicum]
MSKSFSAATAVIFFFYTLLTLSLVDGKKTVMVQSAIGPNVPLTIHCWSSEDDLGVHTLNYTQSFKWKFNVNFRYTTKFICDSSWYDTNTERFTAYEASRDFEVHCKEICVWSIRRDGGYYGDGGAEFPFQKMFSYT